MIDKISKILVSMPPFTVDGAGLVRFAGLSMGLLAQFIHYKYILRHSD
ncbi:hypothetical protein [Alloprevotella tannerae]|nr:hypothetical protein [Alloprevotella tannerae]